MSAAEPLVATRWGNGSDSDIPDPPRLVTAHRHLKGAPSAAVRAVAGHPASVVVAPPAVLNKPLVAYAGENSDVIKPALLVTYGASDSGGTDLTSQQGMQSIKPSAGVPSLELGFN